MSNTVYSGGSEFTRGDPLALVLDRLESVERHNGYFKALCPAHEDKKPSLSITLRDDGSVRPKCFADCSREEILAALGLEWADLYPKRGNRKMIVETYDYTDEAGKLLFQALRYEPKDFRQRKPDGAGDWIYKDVFKNGTQPVLYRLPKVLEAVREGNPIFVVEGEKDVHRLEQEGLTATTCPMGAGKWRDHFSETLAGADVRIVPDNDPPGRDHARKAANNLQGKAASVQIVELPGVPQGGDVSDWLADGGSADELVKLAAQTPEPEPEGKPTNPLLAGRVDMQQVIEHGIEPPEELEPGILLKGAIHHVFGPSESGKTMVVLYLIKRRLEAGEPVVVFDAENGPRTIGERLQRMGLDPKLAVNLYYLPFPDLTVSAESRRAFEEVLDEIEPSLVVFDSWASFLSSAGFSENENAEIEHWDNALTKQAKRRGIASLIIDHVPHDGIRSRGGARKKEVADVQWRVKRTLPFNRDTVGEVVLIKEKDREGWLPGSGTFSVGGQTGKIICRPSAGTVEEHDAADGLKPAERDALATLRDEFGSNGAKAAEWLQAFHDRHGKSEATFYRGLRGLKEKGLVIVVDDSYFPADRPKGGPGGDSEEPLIDKGNSDNYHPLSPNYHDSDDSGTTITTITPFKGDSSDSATTPGGGPGSVEADRTEHQSSIGSAEGGEKRRLTADEAMEVQRLITEGMNPSFAGAEVLGERGEA